MNSVTTVAGIASGGIFAIVIAGLQKVRAFLQYISSFVVVRASMDSILTGAVVIYLKQEFKPVPSSTIHYIGQLFTVRKQMKIVPFRILGNTTLFVKGWKFILLDQDSSDGKLTTLRGMWNLDKFISDALDSSEDYRRVEKSKDEHAASRFVIRKVIGKEKGLSANYSTSNRNAGTVGEEPPSKNLSNSNSIHIGLDKSFKYAENDYLSYKIADPLEGLYFDDYIVAHFDEAQDWLTRRNWYQDKGIPWRKGWLLHGPGGTGKSSIAKATGKRLKIPIYHFYLSTLSDQEFMRHWDTMDTPCIALLEDFDAVFNGRVSTTEHKSLTFDCVLNQISGVSSLDGVFLIITTNRIEMIDPAIGVESSVEGISTRPGRIDTVIKVDLLSEVNKRKMATRVLGDWPRDVEEILADSRYEKVTPAQFQEVLIRKAFSLLATKPIVVDPLPLSQAFKPMISSTYLRKLDDDDYCAEDSI